VLFSDRNFRMLLIADVFSQVSTQIITLALPLVAVVALAAREFQVGLLTALGYAAFILIGLPAGAWVDRMRRRNVMITADVVRAFVLVTIPLAWWADLLTIWQLYVVALAHGVLTVFFDVAYQSYLPFLVGRANLVEGNAKLEIVRSTSLLGGPSLAGGLVQLLGAPLAVAANVVSFVGSACFVGLIGKREPRPDVEGRQRLVQDVKEGLRFVLGNRLLRSIAASTATSNFFFAMAEAMWAIYLIRVIGLSPGQVGVFFSICAVGALAGAALSRRIAAWIGSGPTIWLSLAVSSPFWLLVPLAQPGWTIWLAAGGLAVFHAASVVYNVTQVSFRQGVTPEHLLGRMNATMRFLVWGTLPLGALLGGLLGELAGVRTTMWVAAVGACLAFLPTFLSPLRRMRELPTVGAH
jgi:Na+/melibiose symporter-like transporter